MDPRRVDIESFLPEPAGRMEVQRGRAVRHEVEDLEEETESRLGVGPQVAAVLALAIRNLYSLPLRRSSPAWRTDVAAKVPDIRLFRCDPSIPAPCVCDCRVTARRILAARICGRGEPDSGR